MKNIRMLIPTISLSLLLTACGGGSSSSSSTTPVTEARVSNISSGTEATLFMGINNYLKWHISYLLLIYVLPIGESDSDCSGGGKVKYNFTDAGDDRTLNSGDKLVVEFDGCKNEEGESTTGKLTFLHKGNNTYSITFDNYFDIVTYNGDMTLNYSNNLNPATGTGTLKVTDADYTLSMSEGLTYRKHRMYNVEKTIDFLDSLYIMDTKYSTDITGYTTNEDLVTTRVDVDTDVNLSGSYDKENLFLSYPTGGRLSMKFTDQSIGTLSPNRNDETKFTLTIGSESNTEKWSLWKGKRATH